jgi:hypothetical protein
LNAKPARRQVIHEFPNSEIVLVDDLGRGPDRFEMKAYVVGDDYDLDRDALRDALLTPGPGTLVHPTWGRMNVAIEGEIDCGDAWHLVHTPEHIALFVIDGLGHGSFAAEAAHSGITAFMASPFSAPADTLNRANAVMSKTRGGAGACAVISGERLSYSGIGNISGYIVNPGRSQGLVSHNGTLGLQQRKAAPFEYERPPGSLLVMHSDGVSARWDLKSRPELMACHPAIVASVIYRDHGRGRDDSTVVVVA